MNTVTPSMVEAVSAHIHRRDHCAQTLNITINKVALGYADVSMPVTQAYLNGQGFCQGGIITTLADTAFAHACNACNRLTVGSSLTIDFLRPAELNDTLTAVANELHRGKKTGLYTVNVYNPANQLIAIMSGRSHEIGGAVYHLDTLNNH